MFDAHAYLELNSVRNDVGGNISFRGIQRRVQYI